MAPSVTWRHPVRCVDASFVSGRPAFPPAGRVAARVLRRPRPITLRCDARSRTVADDGGPEITCDACGDLVSLKESVAMRGGERWFACVRCGHRERLQPPVDEE